MKTASPKNENDHIQKKMKMTTPKNEDDLLQIKNISKAAPLNYIQRPYIPLCGNFSLKKLSHCGTCSHSCPIWDVVLSGLGNCTNTESYEKEEPLTKVYPGRSE